MSEYWEKQVIMDKKLTAAFSLVIILAFMGYIIYDASRGPAENMAPAAIPDEVHEAVWEIERTFTVSRGSLSSVAVAQNGMVYLGGDAYVMALNNDLGETWFLETEQKITALAVSGDTVFASTPETILLVSSSGKMIGEWGPYEGNCMITSLSATRKFLVFADAGNKRLFVLDRDGVVYKMMGQGDTRFIIPSPYFDAVISGNLVYAANTGYRRIETWSIEGNKITEFGEPGTAPGAFCGCCNPAHFAVVPQGFITAEKGINRIKISDPDGVFIEFVSVNNDFNQSAPIDVASADGKLIYGANSDDNTLYVFKRK